MIKTSIEIDDSFSDILEAKQFCVMFDIKAVFNNLKQQAVTAKADNNRDRAAICLKAARKLEEDRITYGYTSAELDIRHDMAQQILGWKPDI